MSEVITLSEREQQKLTIIMNALKSKITNGQAAKLLDLSPRQIKRLKQKVRLMGAKAVVHGLTNRKSNHAFSETVKQETLALIEKNYRDFKPGFATEKLTEFHGVEITSQTVRMWMREKGLWKTRKQKNIGTYHAWRPRKEYFGELEQFDGCYHYWFENRFMDLEGQPIEVCLLAAIDDATSTVTKARFVPREGVVPVFLFWKAYMEEKGKPLKIYLDKFSTYKINHKSAVDNEKLMTQFQRAMQTLEIELITAHSPEAKGRIERLFETFQDRLVKEMRLAKINTPDDGNKFLLDIFIPQFNARFSVAPTKEGNVHQPLSKMENKNSNRIFSVQSKRIVNNDFTTQFKNTWYQLAEIQPTTVRARDTMLVEEWIDGTIHFSLKEQYLTYTVLPERPKKTKVNPVILTTHRLNWKQKATHPWNKSYLPKA